MTSYPFKKHLIVVLGPTAVGKTAACITLAQQLGTEIVSADARQCYRHMNIGTAKPTPEEQAAVRHHLVDFLPLETSYSAGAYQKDALAILDKIWEKSSYAILTGGSGLYIDAVCQGFPAMPAIPAAVEAELQAAYAKDGLAPLLAELQAKDPDYAKDVDVHNPRRILRALAICRTTRQPFSFFRQQKRPPRDFNILKIGLQRPRQALYDRINERVHLMISQGLWQEATDLYAYRYLPALATIGYQEIFASLEGKYDRAHAIERIQQNSRNYAKRQITYFKKDPSIHWLDVSTMPNANGLSEAVKSKLCVEGKGE